MSRVVLTAIALALAAILFVSDRPIGLTDMVRIEEMAALPDGPAFEDVRRYTDIGSGLVPYFPGERVAAPRGPARIRLGWIYREISALGMPFFAVPETGPVTFVELRTGRQFAILTPEQAAMIDERLGRPVVQGLRFPRHRHFWGWLMVLALVGWTLLRRREARIREDEHWGS